MQEKFLTSYLLFSQSMSRLSYRLEVEEGEGEEEGQHARTVIQNKLLQ